MLQIVWCNSLLPIDLCDKLMNDPQWIFKLEEILHESCTHHKCEDDAAGRIDEKQLRPHTPQEKAEVAWMPNVPA